MKETIDKIVECEKLPISIIIVGVGNEEFVNMKQLDGDNEKLRSSSGKICERDLVQFVPFKEYLNNTIGLARDTLAELPKQLVDYKNLVGIKPNAPTDVPIAKI